MGWHEWRIVCSDNSIALDTENTGYGNAEIALCDALCASSDVELSERTKTLHERIMEPRLRQIQINQYPRIAKKSSLKRHRQ
jgi:hypothetical protein